MGFPRAFGEALVADLLAKVPTFASVSAEWPEANQPLVYPSLSAETQQPQYERMSPYVRTVGAVTNNQAATSYVVGSYTTQLQLDIWAKYKVQRDTLYEAVFNVLQPVSAQAYILQLSQYYGEWVTVMMRGYKLSSDSDSVKAKTWRATIFLEATCRAINTSTDYIITQPPVLELSTPPRIT